jgi:hypothetical protein
MFRSEVNVNDTGDFASEDAKLEDAGFGGS